MSPSVRADTVADALDARVAEHRLAREVQQRIDAALGRRVDPTEALADQQLANALARANAELQTERARLDQLSRSVAAREQSRAALVPLLEQMLDLLGQSIERDLPVRLDSRRAAVADARALLTDSAASAADRLSAVMALYASERRLAVSVSANAGTVQLEDPARAMTLIRIGRIGLYAVTDDAGHCAVFEREARAWRALPSGRCAALQAWRPDQPLDALTSLPLSVPPDGAP